MNIEPRCQGCGSAYAEAKGTHPTGQNHGNWFCQECAIEQAQVHVFEPDAKRVVIEGREMLTNGQVAERGAIAVCDHSGVCNPDDFNITNLLADLGHFCDREGHNFRAILRRAIRTWQAER